MPDRDVPIPADLRPRLREILISDLERVESLLGALRHAMQTLDVEGRDVMPADIGELGENIEDDSTWTDDEPDGRLLAAIQGRSLGLLV